MTGLQLTAGRLAKAGAVLAAMTLIQTASAQTERFSKTENAAISGHNTKRLEFVEPLNCMSACLSETSFACKSFDYDKKNRACDLSDKSASDVGGLKTDYPGNPYDHYAVKKTYGTVQFTDKGPIVADVMKLVEQVSGQESTLVEEDIPGKWTTDSNMSKWGDSVKGITMTSTGRLVVTLSLSGTSASECQNVMAVSSVYNPAQRNDVSWTTHCLNDTNYSDRVGSVQASGEVVVIARSWYADFYAIPKSGDPIHLPHLKKGAGIDVNTVGLTYDPKTRKHVLLIADGSDTYNSSSSGKLCYTPKGSVLADPYLKFDDCVSISAPISSTGANLFAEPNGHMYIVSTFTTTPYQDATCYNSLDDPGSLRGYSTVSKHEDVLTASYFITHSNDNILQKLNVDERGSYKVRRTQRIQTCVNDRPAYAFGGAIAPYQNGQKALALWAGSFRNTDKLINGEDFEFAQQILDPAYSSSFEYVASIDCQVDGIDDEGTGNTITAKFYDGAGRLVGSASEDGIGNTVGGCSTRNMNLEAKTTAEVHTIMLSTSGNDGFMVDTLEVTKDGEDVRTFGKNDDKGWCMSTDATDGSRSWKFAADNTCSSSISFVMNGNVKLSGNNFSANAPKPLVRYELDIDCDVTGIDNEHTGNQLTATFEDANGKSLGSAILGGGEDGILGCTDRVATVLTQGQASFLVFSTNGGDAAMLDEITLYKNGDEFKVFGDSDRKGWCLSTQEADAHASWQGYTEGNTCKSSFRFPL